MGCVRDRIEIFPALVDPVSASSNPLHFFGLHGRTCAAVQYYAAHSAAVATPAPTQPHSARSRASTATTCSRAAPSPEAFQDKDKDQEKPLLIAAVAANGVNGRTAWSKDLRLSAEDVALLAGHPSTAEALQHVQAQVPLIWHRDNHHRFPRSFTTEMRTLMEALVQSTWFPALPGPTRLGVVDIVAQDLVRQRVWGMLTDAEWARVQRVLQGLQPAPLEGEEAEQGASEGERIVGGPQEAGPSSDTGSTQQEQGAEDGGEGEAQNEDHVQQNEVDPMSPQLVIRLEPRFALGAGHGFGRRPRLFHRLGGWGWLLRSVFPIAMWGLSMKVASKKEALLTVVAYLAGASCVL
ncbi:hypothetical protein DUNSADRAFT_8382 [Dunaliella salina]|uniref:Uncharacterized protein n=1 Tax=Dunaliella salina TaxID=3046 RepID=A0ABQ7GJQ0_DUNSA|nr:hypothetical protein DUNSADRAFT_8382 [Dunaliella salina]|eukprot:KAF5834842.1 hypothetical protein DUNSADRAFT_8382 [Dunaliella salina]